MSEVRKSEFTGDRYGDWVVNGRAPAQNRKRAWHVENNETGEFRVVLQVDLPLLGSQSAGEKPESPWVLTAPNVFFEGNPFNVANDPEDMQFLFNLICDSDFTIPDEQDVRLTAGPSECKHGIHILGCLQCEPQLGDDARKRHAEELELHGLPAYKPLSRQIADAVIASNEAARTEAFIDWSADLDPGEAQIEPEVPVEIEAILGNGLGEFVDEAVSEADLDALVPPQSQLRASIRVLMGFLSDNRRDIKTLHAQIDVLDEASLVLMAAVDDVLKHAVTL